MAGALSKIGMVGRAVEKSAEKAVKKAEKLNKKDIGAIASELERSTGILPEVASRYPFIKDVSVAKMEEIGKGEPITAYRALAMMEGSPIRQESTPSTSLDPSVPFDILTGTPIIIKGDKFLAPEAVVRTYKGIEPTSTEVYVPSMIEEISKRQPEALEMPYRFKSGEKGTVKDVFDAVKKEKELIADVSKLTPSDQFFKSGDGFNQNTYLNVARNVLAGRWKGAEDYLKYQNFTDKPSAIQHLDVFAESIKKQYGKKKGGKVDHALKAWHAAGGGIAKVAKAAGKAAKNVKPPAFGGSYDDSALRRAREEFMTTYGMDFGQGLSKDYDFIDINKVKPSEKVNEARVKELMNAIQGEDPFNTKIPPVIIDSEGNVLDGHHRIEAARRLGIKNIPVIEKFSVQSGTKIIDSNEQNKAHGGEVRMQGGGNAAQIQAQLAAGVPVQMSRGPEGDIARQMILEEEDARRRAEVERRAKMQAKPFGEKLRGGIEAGQTIQSIIGRSLASPFVALAQGEDAARKFAEDVVLPESEYGIYALGRTGEALEPIGRAIEQAKIPDVPFLPEVPTYVPGVARQAAAAAAKAGRAIDQAIPAELKNLPVGASIQPVGPGGEKISINELIRRLEAGEEMTPEQRQKAEYSKAQKEKYAQANVAKAQREPTPQAEEVRVPANESGFFSSVEKAGANLTRKEGTGEAFLSDIMKFNPSAGELEATGIADFLKGKKSVTRQEVQDYINSNKVEIEEVTLGTILSDAERKKLNDINRKLSKNWPFPQRAEDIVTPEEEEWFEATKLRLQNNRDPRHEKENLILPGGKNYREILLKLPAEQSKDLIRLREEANNLDRQLVDLRVAYRDALELDPKSDETLRLFSELRKVGAQKERAKFNLEELIAESKEKTFQTNHWPDDPNTLTHLRMQDMTINGKRTLVVEEIQSDWHQQGRVKGYGPKMETSVEAYYETKDGQRIPVGFGKTKEEAEASIDIGWKDLVDIKYETIDRKVGQGVPEAPFKKDWYQLGMKRVMKYAADNDYDQIALVGPEEQIRRGSLGTHIDGLYFKKNSDGSIKLEAEKDGSVVLDKTVEPKDLELYVGKDVAKKIAKTEDMDGTLTGDDLQIGGEGMRQYYDRNYPEYMNKLGSKYNTKANKINYVTKEFEPDDVEEVDVGEVDRFGRPVMAYRVVDRETGDEVAFEYNWEKALAEANKKAPSTSMWVMSLPEKMRSDVKVGQPFKEGGAVTTDKALMRWHKIQNLAKGGAIKKLAQAAEKAVGQAAEKAKRMSREEAEKAGLWHPISETKLAKPVGEYKATIVEDPGTKMTPRKTMTVEEMQGGVAIPLAGDRAAAGRIIKELEGTPMDVRLEGGPDFMRMHPGAAWASGKGVLSMLADRIKMARESGQPIYGVYTAMSPQAVDFNTMMTESLLNQLDLSGLRKEDIESFNRAVKAVKGQGGKPKAPNFPGVDDPEIREKLLTGPGGQRDAFVKAMAKAEFQKKGFPDVAAARLAVTEPELLDVPRGSTGYTVARLDPEARIFEQSGHTTYPLDIGGEYAGSLERQLPVEVMYPSHFEAKRLMGSAPTGAHKSLELFAPLQYLDQSWLDNAMQYLEMQKKLTGRKKGGLAQARK